MVLTDSHGISRAPCYLGYSSRQERHFDYGVRTLYDQPFKAVRLYLLVTPTDRQNCLKSPTTPNVQRLPAITHARFSLFRFRSPLLTESRLLSLPVGTEMFHFPTFPPLALCVQARVTGLASSRVSPFGNPRITVWLSTPRGLSQIPTSFIGSWCQGIHRTLLKTYTKKLHRALQMLRVHYAILKQHTAPPPPTPTQTHKPRSSSAAGEQPANPEKTTPTTTTTHEGAVPVAEDRFFRTQQRADTPHPATTPNTVPQPQPSIHDHSHQPNHRFVLGRDSHPVTGTMIDVPPLSRTPPHTR